MPDCPRTTAAPLKPVEWVGSALDDLRACPPTVQDVVGYALFFAQQTQLAGVIYVLHVFQKKATRGIATPRHEIELIKQRLQRARQHHAAHYATTEKGR